MISVYRYLIVSPDYPDTVPCFRVKVIRPVGKGRLGARVALLGVVAGDNVTKGECEEYSSEQHLGCHERNRARKDVRLAGF